MTTKFNIGQEVYIALPELLCRDKINHISIDKDGEIEYWMSYLDDKVDTVSEDHIFTDQREALLAYMTQNNLDIKMSLEVVED